jgi:septum formation protein
MRIVLASGSPRRAEVLRDASLPFEVVATEVDESRLAGESPEEMVRRLAEAKARAVAGRITGAALVVAADTVVVAEDDVLGKPASAEDARAMLERLSGRTHQVLSGLTVVRLPDGAMRTELESTQVTFAPLTPEEIAEYVALGEPMDKAGAYAIQGRGGRFVTRIEGGYFNVVGLPLARLYRMLREFGWQEREAGSAAKK